MIRSRVAQPTIARIGRDLAAEIFRACSHRTKYNRHHPCRITPSPPERRLPTALPPLKESRSARPLLLLSHRRRLLRRRSRRPARRLLPHRHRRRRATDAHTIASAAQDVFRLRVPQLFTTEVINMMDTLGILAHEINQAIYERLRRLPPRPYLPRLLQPPLGLLAYINSGGQPAIFRDSDGTRTPRTRHHAPRPLHPSHLRARHPGLRTRRTACFSSPRESSKLHAAANNSASSERPQSSKTFPTAQPSTSAASPSRTRMNSENHPGTAPKDYPSSNPNPPKTSPQSPSSAPARHFDAKASQRFRR